MAQRDISMSFVNYLRKANRVQYIKEGQGKFQARARKFEIHGRANGKPIVANADTGASHNVVSERMAKSMGLDLRSQTAGKIILPTGRRLFSRGQVSLRYQFAGEETVYKLICVVLHLPSTSDDLILGGSFLKSTETFTNYRHRIKRVFPSLRKISLNLIGGQQEFLSGYLNGEECLAVPDTGSDIMAMSRDHAERLGLKIYNESHYRSKVQLIDGSEAITDGIVKDVRWQFRPGENPIRCDFHVIRKLPVKAILSSALIDEFNVFSKYQDRIGRPKSACGEENGIYGIALIERYRGEIRSLSESFREDITSNAPFTPERIERERARRDEIRDRINRMPEPLRTEEQAKEDQRKHKWNELWRHHRQSTTPPPIIAPPEEVVTPLVRVVIDDGSNTHANQTSRHAASRVPFWAKWRHKHRRQ